MILIGIENNIVVLCVSIDADQLELAKQMYPEWILQEQSPQGETIGWLYDGNTFHQP